MGDAEIIPIGTRGRPGRGAGRKTSAASRQLAGGRKTTPPRTPSTAKGPKGASEGASGTADAPTPTKKAPARKPSAPRAAKAAPKPDRSRRITPPSPVKPVTAAGASTDAAATPTDGIPVSDWLAAFRIAAAELFGEDWEPRAAQFLAFVRRRLTGGFEVDEYGFDREFTERFVLTMLRPIADKWFRIEVRGAENLPTSGGALVVSNHSGTVPMDGLMTMVATHDATGRFLRPLGADLVFTMPLVSSLARKSGATLACTEDAERMLNDGELVGVWPEGFKGIGKPFSERYKLQRFGRGGFVSAALRTGVPIVPVSVVGAEEIYPLVGNVPSLARLLGVPYLPITPLFPWLGPLGLVPLPSKWIIEFGEPIRTDEYDGGAAEDPMLVFNVTDQVRETIQQTLYRLLTERGSVFGG